MANKREQAVYVISVAAELAGVHPQTLRIYERRGLIEPYRTPGGTRRYSQADLERLSLIAELTDEGLNLEGVKRVLELENLLNSLRSKVDQLQERVREAHESAEQEIRQVHRSYRSEIVLRRQVLPDVRRKRSE
ncbi:MAG: MerR family transcriptional regulator [Acidimicrobiia bacterium]|nr:MerR family transcriptional regulator [Acidimicrobiia bacterium]